MSGARFCRSDVKVEEEDLTGLLATRLSGLDDMLATRPRCEGSDRRDANAARSSSEAENQLEDG